MDFEHFMDSFLALRSNHELMADAPLRLPDDDDDDDDDAAGAAAWLLPLTTTTTPLPFVDDDDAACDDRLEKVRDLCIILISIALESYFLF